ncbi:MAG TPA: hypothetical protein VE974_29680 [Thermoanaerobaculia bacterium]|nr:hypothetical protein [Thermoanaerobaculia bacterium]
MIANDQVSLIVTSYASDWQFLHDQSIRVIADGRRYVFEATRTSRISPLEETLIANVSVKHFLDVVNASTVEWQAGAHEFGMNDAGIATLKTFASVLALKPQEVAFLLAASQDAAANARTTSTRASSSGDARHPRRVAFENQVRAAAAAPKFYVDHPNRTFHSVTCSDVRPESMPMLIKPAVVLTKYKAHTCVSDAEIDSRRWYGVPPK